MDHATAGAVEVDIIQHSPPRVRHNQVASHRKKDDNKGAANAPTIVARYAYEKFGYSVEKGEELILLKKTNQDWWEVRKASGEVGYVPSVYMNEIRNNDAKVVKLHKKKSIGKADADKSQPVTRTNANDSLQTVAKPADNNEALQICNSNNNSLYQNKSKQEPNSRSHFEKRSHGTSNRFENNIPLKENVQNAKQVTTRTNSDLERMYRVKSLPESQWPKDNFKSYLNFSEKSKHFGSLDAVDYPQSKTSPKQDHIPANIKDWTLKKKLEPQLNLSGSSEQLNKVARMSGPKSPAAKKHASLWQRSFPVGKSKTAYKQESSTERARLTTLVTELKKSSDIKDSSKSSTERARLATVVTEPKKSSDVKEHYISEALKADKGHSTSLVTWFGKSLPGKRDIMSSKVEKLLVTYTQNGSEHTVSYVAKINPRNNISGFEDITNSLIKRDAVFYTEIAPKLNAAMKHNEQEELNIPKCFYVNTEESPEVIIMEDLYAAGYTKPNKKQGLSLDETRLVITALARFHAASIILDTQIDLSRQYPGLMPHSASEENEEEKTILENIVKTGIALLNQLGGYDKAVQWLNEAMPRVQKMFQSCIENCGMLKVLCHGDCIIDNIFFRYDDEGIPVDIKLINFQACVLASPAMDLNYLIFSSLNGSNRHPNTEDLLALYAQVLQQVLSRIKEKISINHVQIKNEYKSKNPYGILIGLSSVSAQVSEEQDIPLVLGYDKGIDVTMNMFSQEWQARQCILLKSNPALSPRLAAIVDDIINFTMAPLEYSM